MEYLQLKKDNIQRFTIKDANGNNTDCILEFDMEDIEMPLKVNKCEYEHKKNVQWLNGQKIIIDKKQDKPEGFMTRNERLKMEALKEFYTKEMACIDLVVGEGKTQEILKAMKRKPYYSMYDDINELLAPILPKLQQTTDSIIQKIKDKYSYKEENVIE